MNLLKKLRQEKSVTQRTVAEDIGITTSYYGMIEVGARTPSLSIAIRLSKYFEVPIEKIFLNN